MRFRQVPGTGNANMIVQGPDLDAINLLVLHQTCVA
jgi:hypothetical protein